MAYYLDCAKYPMRITEILIENQGMFSAVMIHETSPENAEQIRKHGFRPAHAGVFFNVQGANYTGGGWGGTQVKALISGPKKDILDLENEDELPDDLDELADGDEVAEYARRNGYWAWTDGVQFSVLDTNHIKVL